MTNLKSMTLVEALKLRVAIDARIHEMRGEMDKYWDKVFPDNGGAIPADLKRKAKRKIKRIKLKPNHKSPFRGIKVKPKYRGPNGETWAGRGMKPNWLVAAIKGGRKESSFLVK